MEEEARLCVLLSIRHWMWPASEDRHNDRASGTALCLREMPREGPSNWGMSDSLLEQMLRLQQIWIGVLEISLKCVVLQKSQPPLELLISCLQIREGLSDVQTPLYILRSRL